jgi:hypothetical protein
LLQLAEGSAIDACVAGRQDRAPAELGDLEILWPVACHQRQVGGGQSLTYSYDADGDVTGITYPLPWSATWAQSDSISYGYDNADKLTSLTDFNGNKTSISNNADGLPASETLGSTGDHRHHLRQAPQPHSPPREDPPPHRATCGSNQQMNIWTFYWIKNSMGVSFTTGGAIAWFAAEFRTGVLGISKGVGGQAAKVS